MTIYKIVRLKPENYKQCSNIRDMEKNAEQADKWYQELVSGNRVKKI